MLQPRPRRSCPGTPALLWQQARKGKIKTQIPAWIQRNPSTRLRRAQHQTRGLCWEGEEEHGSCDIGSSLYYFFFPLNQPRVAWRSNIRGYIPQVDVSKTHHPPGSCLPKASSLRQRRKTTSLSATAQLQCVRGVSSGCALLRAGTVQDLPGAMQDPPGVIQDPLGAMQDPLHPAARRQRGLCCPPAPRAAAGGVWVAFRDKGPPATRASTPSDCSLAARAAAKCPL